MNLNNAVIGKCSRCGGPVSVPKIWWGVNRPVARCERCGAVADETANLPVIPTIPMDQKYKRCDGPFDRYKLAATRK